jgi:hypothetical protein
MVFWDLAGGRTGSYRAKFIMDDTECVRLRFKRVVHRPTIVMRELAASLRRLEFS